MRTLKAVSTVSLMDACREVFKMKIPDSGRLGWSPILRSEWGYYTPDEVYEAVLLNLVDENTDWLDVGCGHRLFPSNPRLEELLAIKCRSLTGIDPDPAVHFHKHLSDRQQCTIEEFSVDRKFNLISIRMVAEHVENPSAVTFKLSDLTSEDGRVVVYTVNKWSPISLLAAVSPTSFHHLVKARVWGTEEQDTFPTFFRMNTRKDLQRVFEANGFMEEAFLCLNDCRTFGGWKPTATLELALENLLRTTGLPYIDTCLLGIYHKKARKKD
jgi:2-polyprenyl-3-methyl-5-hydroxy-6-metoxy-1,4-benzoquinol methylase